MRKLIAGFAISLDGFIEGPNGEIDWIIFDKEQERRLAETWKNFDAMFHGRKTYEVERAMEKKSKSKSNPFAHMKHYVFSNTLETVDEGFVLVKGDITKEIQKIKQEEGKNIAVFGGAELLSSLLNLGLIDELSLAVTPIILGNGKPMFQKIKTSVHLSLTESKSLSSGVVILNYTVQQARP
jgi:dihydrofolate reductase